VTNNMKKLNTSVRRNPYCSNKYSIHSAVRFVINIVLNSKSKTDCVGGQFIIKTNKNLKFKFFKAFIPFVTLNTVLPPFRISRKDEFAIGNVAGKAHNLYLSVVSIIGSKRLIVDIVCTHTFLCGVRSDGCQIPQTRSVELVDIEEIEGIP